MKLGGVVDDDGTIPLAAGANVITIEVTAEDAVTTQTYTVTVTRATPSAPVTVTLAPRVEGSNTYVNITIEWNDPQPCDGRYMVALYTSSDYFVQLLGFRTASETASIATESATDWDLSRFPDWFAGVSCHPRAGCPPRPESWAESPYAPPTPTTTSPPGRLDPRPPHGAVLALPGRSLRPRRLVLALPRRRLHRNHSRQGLLLDDGQPVGVTPHGRPTFGRTAQLLAIDPDRTSGGRFVTDSVRGHEATLAAIQRPDYPPDRRRPRSYRLVAPLQPILRLPSTPCDRFVNPAELTHTPFTIH